MRKWNWIAWDQIFLVAFYCLVSEKLEGIAKKKATIFKCWTNIGIEKNSWFVHFYLNFWKSTLLFNIIVKYILYGIYYIYFCVVFFDSQLKIIDKDKVNQLDDDYFTINIDL